jgi:hypothetical protein
VTSVRRSIGGRTVSARCAPGQEPLAEDVLSTFARITGTRAPDAGEQVRFGWSLLTLRDEPSGELIVCEPDFGGDPLRESRPRIDTTLAVLAEQTALVRRAGVEPADVAFDQFVIVARRALASPVLHLFRANASNDEDSGWSITAPGETASPDAPEDYAAARVYQFLELRRAILTVLALPPQFAAVVDGDRIVTVLDDHGQTRVRNP